MGMVQLFAAARLRGIPVLLRMDSNLLRPRPFLLRLIYWFLFRGVNIGLPVGMANAEFYRRNGIPDKNLIASPHYVDNVYFSERCASLRPHRPSLRKAWRIPERAFCFLFAGKLQAKKHPLALLRALRLVSTEAMVGKPLHLLMVGSGPLEQECRHQVKDGHLPVSFAGFLNQSEMPSAYAVSYTHLRAHET